MAKIKEYGRYGIPLGTPVPSGMEARCECGTLSITEGNENCAYYSEDHSIVAWSIRCPSCGGSVHVRHPQAPKEPQKTSGCFVATCCFGEPMAPEIIQLRRWRDEKLINSTMGRRFVSWYYSGHGEQMARFIRKRLVFRRISRTALRLFIRLVVKQCTH